MNRWTQDPTNRRKIVLTVNQKETVAMCNTAGAAALIVHRLANYGPLVNALKELVHGATHTPALDSSEEWTALIKEATAALRQAGEI